MALTPITPQRQGFDGYAITIAVPITSTGNTNETCTLPAGIPSIDYDLANPVLSMLFISTEGDSPSNSVVFLPSAEVARDATPDTTGEWSIPTNRTILHRSATDTDGILLITYIPKGVQVQ